MLGAKRARCLRLPWGLLHTNYVAPIIVLLLGIAIGRLGESKQDSFSEKASPSNPNPAEDSKRRKSAEAKSERAGAEPEPPKEKRSEREPREPESEEDIPPLPPLEPPARRPPPLPEGEPIPPDPPPPPPPVEGPTKRGPVEKKAKEARTFSPDDVWRSGHRLRSQRIRIMGLARVWATSDGRFLFRFGEGRMRVNCYVPAERMEGFKGEHGGYLVVTLEGKISGSNSESVLMKNCRLIWEADPFGRS